MTSVLVLFTQGNVDTMAGIYTMAFLTVMILFTVGNMLIKLKRSTLPTPMRVPFPTVILAFFMMITGLVGNVMSADSRALSGFIMFGAMFFIPVLVMLNRVILMRIVSSAIRPCVIGGQENGTRCTRICKPCCGKFIQEKIHDPLVTRMIALEQKPLVFFTADDEPTTLLNAILYFRKNEARKWYKFVRVFDNKSQFPANPPDIYKALGKLIPDVQIDFVATAGRFCPQMVQMISAQYKVPTNFMFMSSFGAGLEHSFMELGGLRLITSNRERSEEEEEARKSAMQRTSKAKAGDNVLVSE
jgi:Na+-translocating ferredoxin:NAD+ oxidoreductase RnfE subunit